MLGSDDNNSVADIKTEFLNVEESIFVFSSVIVLAGPVNNDEEKKTTFSMSKYEMFTNMGGLVKVNN